MIAGIFESVRASDDVTGPGCGPGLASGVLRKLCYEVFGIRLPAGE